VSVDTYMGSRNLRNYITTQVDDVEVLVSRALSPLLERITLEHSKFLFIHRLRARLELSDGRVVSA
jgi:hypothetical protein